MATTDATASRDKLVRRQAQAQEHADQGGGGETAFLLIAAGLAAFGVYELTKGKGAQPQDPTVPPPTPTCPAGSLLINGQCLTPPAGYPPIWCTLEAEPGMGNFIIQHNLLGRWPVNADGSRNDNGLINAYNGAFPYEHGNGGFASVGAYIANSQEFINDVNSFVGNPGAIGLGDPAAAGSPYYGWNQNDKTIAIVFALFLRRWPGNILAAWEQMYASGGVPGVSEAFFNSQEFAIDVPSWIASVPPCTSSAPTG